MNQRYLPRWVVLALDVTICIFSFAMMFFIMAQTPLRFNNYMPIEAKATIFIGINILYFYLFRTYSGIVRHSTFTDIVKLASASLMTALTVIGINYVFLAFLGQKIFLVPAILLYMFFSFTMMLFFRIAVKEVFHYLQQLNSGKLKKRVFIVGIDNQTINLGRALATESNLSIKLVGFLTEKSIDKSLSILGKPVFSLPINKDSKPFAELVAKSNIDGVLMVRDSLSISETNQIVEACLVNNMEVFNIPLVENWNKKGDIQNQIRPIEIEDLLDRQPIKIDTEIIEDSLIDKTILVTGGAGSIGSELVKQLAVFSPKKILILDNAESALYDMELLLKSEFPSLNFITLLADIRNVDRLEMIFSKYKFDFVYHAAAYKHVPMIEKNPHEAVSVNIQGTINLANLSVQHGVDKFVMISTDKAVNPSSVMGASKRAAEMYVQSLQEHLGIHTKFITTRFGNVLGSNGSVIPYFRKQIAAGGPVTVTHKNIIRYFMTISEACQLVLQAGTMGNGGEIYIFDMGEPIRILDMAEKMIRLSGFIPYKDIDIKIIGLRPGEKLYEELLSDSSKTLSTYHPKIMISKVPSKNFLFVEQKVQEILLATEQDKIKVVVKKIKELVPEFLSQNSYFQELDKVHQA